MTVPTVTVAPDTRGVSTDFVVSLAPRSAIPDDLRDRIIALADAGEIRWRGIAVITRAILTQTDIPRMRVYGDVAALAREKAGTVRAWTTYHKIVGEALLDELPVFGYSHWRLLVRAARQSGRELSDVALEWAATADDYAGLPIPVDALAAKLNGRPDPRPPYERARERAQRAVASMARHAGEKPARVRAEIA